MDPFVDVTLSIGSDGIVRPDLDPVPLFPGQEIRWFTDTNRCLTRISFLQTNLFGDGKVERCRAPFAFGEGGGVVSGLMRAEDPEISELVVDYTITIEVGGLSYGGRGKIRRLGGSTHSLKPRRKIKSSKKSKSR